MNWEHLRTIPGITCFEPASAAALESLPVKLPPAHVDLLRCTDGLVSGGGYIRVFGVSGCVRDQVWWNDTETWRFASPNDGSRFWFFAETARGAQYAYERDEKGVFKDWVVYVDSLMIPHFTLPSFETFVQNAVIKFPDRPSDATFNPILNRLGPIPPDKLVVPVPHPCLGESDPEQAMLMDARSALILDNDLYRECCKGDVSPGKVPMLETYKDEKGRMRFRIGGA